MARSLQTSLQRRFCCTMFIALALMGAWAYWGVRQTLNRQLDQSLRSAGHSCPRVSSLPTREDFAAMRTELMTASPDRVRTVNGLPGSFATAK